MAINLLYHAKLLYNLLRHDYYAYPTAPTLGR
jgi:hypothetical protein